MLVGDGGFRSLHVSFRLIDRHPEIPIIDSGENLAGLDLLVVAHQHLADVPGDLGRDGRVVGFHVGIIGRNLEPADRPIRPAEVSGSRNCKKTCPDHQQPAQPGARFIGTTGESRRAHW